jgi:hypothetical protein
MFLDWPDGFEEVRMLGWDLGEEQGYKYRLQRCGELWKYRIGDRILPWGTPASMGWMEDGNSSVLGTISG